MATEDVAAGDSHGPTLQAYFIVFGALCVFTLVSFVVNAMVNADHFSAHAGMAIIMAVAVCKATLVIMFFMHLKYEWMKLYFLIVPVVVLCVMMMIVLMPDIVVAWHPDEPAASAQK
ncbi:MAG TPA: cytochrome C oxidase subunit IV family protein [Gemmataceae bacterium]|nr:cytochrome C oxidase subunit IV family protein [Gemmataceae bacterium]